RPLFCPSKCKSWPRQAPGGSFAPKVSLKIVYYTETSQITFDGGLVVSYRLSKLCSDCLNSACFLSGRLGRSCRPFSEEVARMYSLVLATMLTTGAATPDWRFGCHGCCGGCCGGCWGCCGGCWGCCGGCGGCYGCCGGCWGGCYGWSSGCYGCWG